MDVVKCYTIGTTVYWSDEKNEYEGIIIDDLGKDRINILCVKINTKRVCKKKNIIRELIYTKKGKMAIDVKKTLLTNKFKKHGKDQLLTYVRGTGFTDEEKEVITEILILRGIKKEDILEELELLTQEEIIEEKVEVVIEEKQEASEEILEVNKTQRRDILYVDPRVLATEEGFNTRFDFGEIDELKNSIIENGVRIPLRGYKEGEIFILTDGHRRLMATMKAIEEGVDIARVPFISEKKRSLEERLLDILLSNDGKRLTSLELGETYRRLVTHGYSYAEIARKIGKTANHVSDMVKVAESSKELKGMIKEGNVSASLVSEVKKRLKNDEKAENILKKKVNEAKKKVEESGSDEPAKVTRKDLSENVVKKEYPKKEIPAILDIDDNEDSNDVKKELKEKNFFSKDEVIVLLKKQVKSCQDKLPKQFQANLNDIELVLI